MRDFTWHVFTQTGDIEAYLLYKEVHNLGASEPGAGAGLEEGEIDVANEE
ncbi:YqzL family protein [Cohnella sp. LGH]|uniref:YqzL-like protein n=1 Tax=Cohnella phaseoli TaxID=456490 RepID=A0A3D9IR35_9BACL|nr:MULTISPECIES: YqzL family protein [Cohnella]QTH46139.1 YqzL family protein [Cohnella sp. LGH]RED64241.1 YqzL-like protein [Cohnella phaseoli]